MTRRAFTFRFRSAEHWLEFFRSYYGPTAKAFEALEARRDGTSEEYERGILELIARFNRSGDDTMVVPSEYLEIVAVRS
jgi:hypothetical protein